MYYQYMYVIIFFIMENFKESKSLNQIFKKISKINEYLKDNGTPTYKDFLYYANITSQDFNFLYQKIMENDNKAKKIYYILERIKLKFELEMEKLLRYQNHTKRNFNYRLLRDMYLDSVNSPISMEFKSIEVVNGNFINKQEKNNDIFNIPNNESGVDIFDMRKKVEEIND